ncbi:hypothetical protein HHI36_017368 [Cryptolaemus montrouzieri]|uniref:Uncharacterized protein n=1 Tax=Cryptolaemus montrouzieri TaxID=559131 RepID=A0ABD2NMC7_9CUCU
MSIQGITNCSLPLKQSTIVDFAKSNINSLVVHSDEKSIPYEFSQKLFVGHPHTKQYFSIRPRTFFCVLEYLFVLSNWLKMNDGRVATQCKQTLMIEKNNELPQNECASLSSNHID